MLTTADYRAAVLGAYRRYRALGEQPRVAYRLATAVTAPLPVGRCALGAAYARIADPVWRSCNTDAFCNTPRQLWAQAWCDARYFARNVRSAQE